MMDHFMFGIQLEAEYQIGCLFKDDADPTMSRMIFVIGAIVQHIAQIETYIGEQRAGAIEDVMRAKKAFKLLLGVVDP